MQPQQSIISVITENEPGVLARIAGMLSGRGYNIDSLTVAPINATQARFTIQTTASEEVVGQIVAQLGRLVPVVDAFELPCSSAFVARELALVKLDGRDAGRIGLNDIAGLESIRTIADDGRIAIFELTGTTAQIDAFTARLMDVAAVEIVRTGTAAVASGPLRGHRRGAA